jgi:archaemetzincin
LVDSLQLVPLSLSSGEGTPVLALLDRLAADAACLLQTNCHVDAQPQPVDFAYDLLRRQVWSTPILARLQERRRPLGAVVLGITELDLYVPVFTFVFGEAQLRGPAAIVSTHRLREEFYGMPADDDTLIQRLLKELLHELGHTQGLRHCTDWNCVMSSAHTVERIDIRQPGFCAACAGTLAR